MTDYVPTREDMIANFWFEVDDLRKQLIVFAADARHEPQVLEDMLMAQSHLGHAMTHLKWGKEHQLTSTARGESPEL